jgi:hypothetical protein
MIKVMRVKERPLKKGTERTEGTLGTIVLSLMLF